MAKTMSPADLALKVDAFKSLRDRRLELQREVEQMKEHEDELKVELINMFRNVEITSLGGKLATITLVEKTSPVVSDWEKLYDHIQKTGHFDLLQRRLGIGAVKARWEEEHDVPGVTTESYYDLSVRKI